MDVLTEIFTRITEIIDSLTVLVTDSPITYLVILALAGLDVLVPILPSEASITAAAVLAGQGTLNIVWVMLAAGVGAFLGDNVAYWVGRVAGRPVVKKILRGDMQQLDGVQEQFDRRGGIFIIVGRFIPGGRTTVAIGAGILHFNWLQFIVYDAIAAVAWAFQAALPGFIGGSMIQDRPWLALLFGFALSGTLALVLALGQRWWERRTRQQGRDRDGGKDDDGDEDAESRAQLRRDIVSRVTGIPSVLPNDDVTTPELEEPPDQDAQPSGSGPT